LAFHSGREADHSPLSSAEVKEWVVLYLHSPNTPSWRGAQLGGAQVQLYLYLEKLSHSVSQEISHLLLNSEDHYHVHKSPPLVPILSQMHSVHTFPSYYFPKIHKKEKDTSSVL
jgi:hypothetical protein